MKVALVWNERVSSVAFSRDGNWLAFGNIGGAYLDGDRSVGQVNFGA